jgi:hypothetical protein
MKVKTNIRAGKNSGTVLSNTDLGISGGGKANTVGDAPDVTTSAPAPVVYTRCVGI